VYDALRAQLSFPWHVFYSRPWLGIDRNGLEREGEADFVLAHPQFGMIVLEVKGGTISRDASADQWWSKSNDGLEHRIKNPVDQANRNKHALKDLLSADPRWHRRRINAVHAVVFPSCSIPSDALGADMPRLLFAGQAEMDSLEPWLMRRLRHESSGAAYDELGADGLELLKRHFALSFTLEQPAAVSLQADDNAIRLLTDEQVRALDIFDDARRIGIPGVAGTGKTSLAVAQALRLARAGSKTLLLCYNKPLARHLQREVGSVEGLRVSTYHSLCHDVAERARIPVQETGFMRNETHLFNVQYPQALVAGLGRLTSERFDAVIVDEGQDFPSTWFASVELLLRDQATSRLFIFHDDNQKVHSTNRSIAANVPQGAVRLKRILRNSRQIVEQLDPLLPRPYTADGPAGGPVEWLEAKSEIATRDIEELIEQLVGKRMIRPEHIAVLFSDERERSRFVVNDRIGRWTMSDAEAIPRSSICCDTIRRFKGLERPVVIVVEPEREIGSPQMLYTALTRARVLLVLLGSVGRLSQLELLLKRSDPTA
jgi:hypothetical protein